MKQTYNITRHKFKRNKFNAKKTKRDGITFDSILEADYYDRLKSMVKGGVILFFLRQCAFDLPGNVKYRCDFQEFWCDGTVRFVDTKGKITDKFKQTKKIVEALYPVEIVVIKREDFK